MAELLQFLAELINLCDILVGSFRYILGKKMRDIAQHRTQGGEAVSWVNILPKNPYLTEEKGSFIRKMRKFRLILSRKQEK